MDSKTKRHAKRGMVLSSSTRKAKTKPTSKPPKAGAYKKAKVQSTMFRKFYERGDLPCAIEHQNGRNGVKWAVDVKQLDYHRYLPIFFDGIRELKDPYKTLAINGITDMLQFGYVFFNFLIYCFINLFNVYMYLYSIL